MTVSKRIVNAARYIAKVESKKGESEITCTEIYDKVDDRFIDLEKEKPALKHFLNAEDMKESLCWCLNCYDTKYGVAWANTKTASYGTVYLVA